MEVFNEQDKKLVQKLEKYAVGEECNIYEHLTAVALDNICGKVKQKQLSNLILLP